MANFANMGSIMFPSGGGSSTDQFALARYKAQLEAEADRQKMEQHKAALAGLMGEGGQPQTGQPQAGAGGLMGLPQTGGTPVNAPLVQSQMGGLNQQQIMMMLQSPFAEVRNQAAAMLSARNNPETMIKAREYDEEAFNRTRGLALQNAIMSNDPAAYLRDALERDPRLANEPWARELLDPSINLSPQAFKRNLELAWAATDPDGWESYYASKTGDRDYLLELKKLDLDWAKLNDKEELTVSDVTGIHNTLDKVLTSASEIKQSYIDLAALEKGGTPSDKLAATFKFMKTLDPSSTVAASEQGMLAASGGVLDGMIAMYNQAVGEGGMTETMFRHIVNTAYTLANSAIKPAREKGITVLNTYGDLIDSGRRTEFEKKLPTLIERAGENPPAVQQAPAVQQTPAVQPQAPVVQSQQLGDKPKNFNPELSKWLRDNTDHPRWREVYEDAKARGEVL